MLRFEVLVLLVGVFTLCKGRPSGAPESACLTLTPVHEGASVQQSESPYKVSATRNGDKIRVKISSSLGEGFSGFVLQARSSENRSRIIDGTFTEEDGVSKTIQCSKGIQNTLTHVDTGLKQEIVTEWTPSSELNEDIVLRATVAKTYSLFWTEIDSEPIKFGSGTSGNNNKSKKKEIVTAAMYDKCSKSKGCVGLPSDCIERRDCEALLSYSEIKDGITFKIIGILKPRTYMAMGLSRDNTMGNDFVTACVRGNDSSVLLRESWNNQNYSNSLIREYPTDEFSSTFTDGTASCSWTAKRVSEKNGRIFDFDNSYFFILLASGPMRNDKLSIHTKRSASHAPVKFTSIEGKEIDSRNNDDITEENSDDKTEDSSTTSTEDMIEGVSNDQSEESLETSTGASSGTFTQAIFSGINYICICIVVAFGSCHFNLF